MRLFARPLLLVLLVIVAGGCRRAAPPPATTKSGPRKVVLQTDWFPQAEHGGFYQALAKGYYAQAGLEVQILPGGPGAGIKLKVARGDADFGMLRSDDIIVAASRGLPFVIVMATMQHDPQAVMVHDESPVRSLRDLNGRVVIASPSMAWIPYVQKKYGIKFDLKPNTYGLGEFLANPDAIQQCLVTNEPYFAQQHGQRVRTLSLADSGYDSYHAVFVRRELMQTAPEVVRAFVWASIHGWRDYLEGDPAPADTLILQRNAQMTPELLKFSRSEMIIGNLVHGPHMNGDEIGRIALTRLAAEMQTLVELRVLDGPVPIANIATKDFLPP
jgi:NitT/TauT family transport system substrate-binding protein